MCNQGVVHVQPFGMHKSSCFGFLFMKRSQKGGCGHCQCRGSGNVVVNVATRF